MEDEVVKTKRAAGKRISGGDEKGKSRKHGNAAKLTAWHRLNLSDRTYMAVRKFGFRQPTPIQRKAIPAILKKQGDVIGMARTGSGKTAAFVLPMIECLDVHSETVGARGLILSPTRELALQTGGTVRKLCGGTNLRCCFLTGGSSLEKQFEHLALNPDIIIGTPGRLNHAMVETGYTLSRVEMAVFDEADQLFELGYEEDLKKILKELKLSSRQLVLMSATLPTRLVEFTKLNFLNPVFIQLDMEKQLSQNLSLDFFYCRSCDKIPALLFWLTAVKEPEARVMIFCATVHHVNFLSAFLRHLRINNSVVAGRLDQTQRDEAMKDFQAGRSKILIATDLAARGVDIPLLEYVLHYNFPASAKLFVHRSGRTARKDEKGTAVSFVLKDDIPLLQELSVFLGCKIGPQGEKDAIEMGGFPDLQDEREQTAEALARDPDLARLNRSMLAGQECYAKWTSKEYSKLSKKRAGELLNQFGGPQALNDHVHSKLTKFVQVAKAATIKIAKKQEQDVNKLLGLAKAETEDKSAPQVSVAPSNVINLSLIRQFRPCLSTSSSRGSGVKISTMKDLRASREERLFVRQRSQLHNHSDSSTDVSDDEAFRTRPMKYKSQTPHMTKPSPSDELPIATTHPEEGSTPHEDASSDAESDDEGENPQFEAGGTLRNSTTLSRSETGKECTSTKRPLSKAERRRLKRGCASMPPSNPPAKRAEKKDFFIDVNVDERSAALETELNSINRMERESMNVIPDEEGKIRQVMKWNALKKKYQVTAIDQQGKRIKVKNNSGTVVRGEVESKGLYKRWSRGSERRIQRVGEQEDPQNYNSFISRRLPRSSSSAAATMEPLPLEEVTKDLGLLEKVKTHRELTHKEGRKLKRLQQIAKSPISEGGKDGPTNREVKSLLQLKASHKRTASMRRRHDVKARTADGKKAKDKFMAKRRAQAARRGAMTRSAVIRHYK